jgi:hypothetical protein
MKKILVVLALVLLGSVSYAQWSTNGTSVYYNGGNVGIGTSTPAERLNVQNSGAAGNILMERIGVPYGSANATLSSIRLKNTTTGDYFNFSFRYRNEPGNVNHEIIQSAFYAPTSSFKEFSYFNFGTGKYEIRGGVSDILFLNSGGIGVGLGTMAIPTGAKLAVGGKVVCKEIEVTLTGLPDFVFNSDYKLMSLYDVENFINTNKHLPNVPSEKEVIENGLNLGDMNATLLQKVEELTLYMINLQKENDALKARVSNLEK